MAIQKYIPVKVFLAVFFLAVRLTLFSQVNHEDSINYHYSLEKNNLFGTDLRGKTIPDFIVKDKNGKLFTNDNLRSKITFINFWFEACAPCLAEFQALEKFYNKNKSRENFQFISITYEQDSVIERVREKNNLSYPIYHLSRDSCRKMKFNTGYPTSLIVNKNLEIVYSTFGGSTDPKEADKFLNYFVQAELDKQLD